MAVTNQRTRDLIKTVLSQPELFPDEFKSWIPRALVINPLFSVPESALPPVAGVNFVGLDSTQPPFQNSWVNNGSYESAGFYKDVQGRTFLSGVVKSGAAGTVIFTLPAGYRPRAREGFATVTNTGFGSIEVSANGDVTFINGGTTSVSLSGISFRAAQ